MSTFGRKGIELVREMYEADRSTLPAYNANLVRAVKEEVSEHHKFIVTTLSKLQSSGDVTEAPPEESAPLLLHNTALLRNKRLLLAYTNARIEKIRSLRWEVGASLPEEIEGCMSLAERDFFKAYSALLGGYMSRPPKGVGINLTLDLQPLKVQKVFVKVLQDYGSTYTRDGPLLLVKDARLYMWRDDVQHLVQEGVVELCVDG